MWPLCWVLLVAVLSLAVADVQKVDYSFSYCPCISIDEVDSANSVAAARQPYTVYNGKRANRFGRASSDAGCRILVPTLVGSVMQTMADSL
eukprot:scaffold386513_cov21-Prasinocladus_malaysianus.AAC.1